MPRSSHSYPSAEAEAGAKGGAEGEVAGLGQAQGRVGGADGLVAAEAGAVGVSPEAEAGAPDDGADLVVFIPSVHVSNSDISNRYCCSTGQAGFGVASSLNAVWNAGEHKNVVTRMRIFIRGQYVRAVNTLMQHGI